VKVLTLTQPCASLMAFGHKTIETRSWPTSYRGTLAIHAVAGIARDLAPIAEAVRRRAWRVGHLGLHAQAQALPRGAILAVVWLWDVCRTEEARLSLLEDDDELEYGDFTPGRWARWTRQRQCLPEPIPCRGTLGLWTLPPEIEARMREEGG
jgi:hypothetical protein